MLEVQQSPSAWVQRFLQNNPAAHDEQRWLIDWACGGGRHSLLALERGWSVLAMDQDVHALGTLREAVDATNDASRLHCLEVNLEASNSLGLVARALSDFGFLQVSAMVVCNYLHRPSWLGMLGLLEPGGSLIYETFAQGHERLGRPRRGAFLLQPGELLAKAQASHLAVIAYEDVLEVNERDLPRARKQRLYARKPGLASNGNPWLS